MNSTISLAWKILFNEEYEETPDPNNIENQNYLKAKRKETEEGFRKLMSGHGKVIFESWRDKIKKQTLSMLYLDPKELCNCQACQLIRSMRGILDLWLEMEFILNQKNKEK